MPLNRTTWPVHLGRLVIALCLPILLVTSSVLLVTGLKPFYAYAFAKYHISDVTGVPDPQLVDAAEQIMAYFSTPAEPLDVEVNIGGLQRPLFNQKEVDHMRDVKQLFLKARIAEVGSGLLAMVVMGALLARGGVRGRWAVASGLVWGGGIALGLLIAAVAGVLTDFDGLFIQFHLLSFSNDFWQLDPRKDILVMMFPLEFWVDATLLIAVITAVVAALLYGLGWYLLGRLYAGPSASGPAPETMA